MFSREKLNRAETTQFQGRSPDETLREALPGCVSVASRHKRERFCVEEFAKLRQILENSFCFRSNYEQITAW